MSEKNRGPWRTVRDAHYKTLEIVDANHACVCDFYGSDGYGIPYFALEPDERALSLITDAPAMAMVLDMIERGLLQFHRFGWPVSLERGIALMSPDNCDREHGGVVTDWFPLTSWPQLIESIGWDRCRELCKAHDDAR